MNEKNPFTTVRLIATAVAYIIGIALAACIIGTIGYYAVPLLWTNPGAFFFAFMPAGFVCYGLLILIVLMLDNLGSIWNEFENDWKKED